MTSYTIVYTIGKNSKKYSAHIEAEDIKSAKRKLGKKHGYKDGRMIKLRNVLICGYF